MSYWRPRPSHRRAASGGDRTHNGSRYQVLTVWPDGTTGQPFHTQDRAQARRHAHHRVAEGARVTITHYIRGAWRTLRELTPGEETH
ncbi:hypothetical protein [Streptomyces mayteni]